MILSSIKNGNLFTPVIIVISGLILWWKTLFINPISSFTDFGVLSHFFQGELFDKNFWLSLLSFITIFITAFVLNRTIDQDEFFEKNTFLPAFFYVLFMSIPVESQGFSPIVFSNLFLMISFYWYLKIRRQEDAREIIFNASFYLSIAVLLFPVYLPLLISPFILLLIFRPFVWREWALSLIGIFTPVAFYFFGLYYFDINFEQNTYNESFWLTWEYSAFTTGNRMLISGFITLLILFSLYIINKKFNSSSIRLRKFFYFILFQLALFIMTSISLYSLNELMLDVMALPLSLVISYYFYYAKKLWSNLFFYLLILSALLLVYFS